MDLIINSQYTRTGMDLAINIKQPQSFLRSKKNIFTTSKLDGSQPQICEQYSTSMS